MSLSYPADDYAKPRGRGRSLALTPLAPVLIGAALAVAAIAARSKIGAWMRGFLIAPRGLPPRDNLAARIEAGLSLRALRKSILGRKKSSIVTACGRPRTAVMNEIRPALPNQAAFWRADTWYYAIDAKTQTAMAIRFIDGIARGVEFFESPK